MATAIAQSLTIPAGGASPVGQIHGCSRTGTLAARADYQIRCTSSSLQAYSGMRKVSIVDTLAVKQGQDFKSVMAAAVRRNHGPWKPRSRGVTTAKLHFTEKADKVIELAEKEARGLGVNFVDTEHILLGLIGEGTGNAAKVLKSMGVNLKEARVEVEKIIGRGSETTG